MRLRFCEQQVSRYQKPYQVDPTEYACRNRCNDRENKREKARSAHPCRPTHDDFNYPVYAGDKQKDQFHQKVLIIEPLRQVIVLSH